MKKKTNKFYLKNEKKVLEKLGFKQVAGSGNGWIHKEDGENDFALAQLKTTEKESISLKKLDLDKLVHHAEQIGKIPVFVLEFLGKDTVVCLRQEDLIEFLERFKEDKGEEGYVKNKIQIKEDVVVEETKIKGGNVQELLDNLYMNYEKPKSKWRK